MKHNYWFEKHGKFASIKQVDRRNGLAIELASAANSKSVGNSQSKRRLMPCPKVSHY